MTNKKIYREPLNGQDGFIISTIHKQTENMRRGLELCKEMYFNRINFCNVNKNEIYDYAIACEEVAIDGVFHKTELAEEFNYVIEGQCDLEMPDLHRIVVRDKAFSPEKLRFKIYEGLLCGAKGIEYDSAYDGAITKNDKEDGLFYYIRDINQRLEQIGRTLMALKQVATYQPQQWVTESEILSRQEIPQGCAVSEFMDCEGHRYLLIQNQDCIDKSSKVFRFDLKKSFRVYRVNPHNGKQMITKEKIDTFKILLMPGDADVLRFQDVKDKAYLIDYVLKK